MNRIICGQALDVLKTIPEESVDCVVTSPPYWALRDYGVDGQMGLEQTIHEHVQKLCDIFDEVRRVLKTEGTCWVNLGDTYYTVSGGKFLNDTLSTAALSKAKGVDRGNELKKGDELPPKSLCNIPARFSLEMQKRGWILRNVIIWHKPNCMPSSVRDRFTVDFEYVFFFVKSVRYWFETQYEPSLTAGSRHVAKHCDKSGLLKRTVNATYFDRTYVTGPTRHKRCVWTIPPGRFRGAHFAVYPPRLIETPVRAGCARLVCRRCGRPAGPERA